MENEELNALHAEAAAIDAVIAPPAAVEEAAQVEPVISEAASIAALLTITTGLFAPVFPSLSGIYTPDTINSIASAAEPVMLKHGWSTGDYLGKYGEELALVAVVMPIAALTYNGIRADIGVHRLKGKEEGGEQAITNPPEEQPDAPEPVFLQRG